MGQPNADILLEEIAAAITDALAFIDGLAPEAFQALPLEDSRTFRAIKNAVAEVGEAIKLPPSDIPARHPGVDWRGLAGLRDIIVHRYLEVDLLRLWPVLAEEFPVVLAAVEAERKRRDA